jgi:hypothetical protein
MGRALWIGIALFVAGLLAWEFVPIQVTVWDGGFDLAVTVTSSAGPLRAVSCEAFGRRDYADEALEFLMSPMSPWSARAKPFGGEPLTVNVSTSGRASPSGRELSRFQFRHLVVIGEFHDGRRVGKLVQIPDGEVSRKLSVTLP